MVDEKAKPPVAKPSPRRTPRPTPTDKSQDAPPKKVIGKNESQGGGFGKLR